MRGLDPRIHLSSQDSFKRMGCRGKPGNDGWGNGDTYADAAG
jgi:hypothetical protein